MSLTLPLSSSLTPCKTLPPLHHFRPPPSHAQPLPDRHKKSCIWAKQCPITTTTSPPPPPPSPLELPPGPWRLPFIGSLHHMISPLPFRRLRDLADSHGPVMLLRLGEIDTVVISSPEAAHEVVKKQDLNFVSRPPIMAAKIITYDCTNIAFAPYGPYWRQLRHLCITELLSAKRVKSFASLRAEETMNMVRAIATNSYPSTRHEAVPLSEMVMEMNNNTVARALFGDLFGDQKRYFEVAERMVEMGSGFSVADLFPSLKVVDALTGFSAKLERVHAELDEMMTAIVDEHEGKGVHGEEEREDLVDVLLRIKERGDLEVPVTLENIKAVVSDMFIGGTETSTTTIEWAMSELIRHPNILKKAQQEVRQAMKQKAIIEEKDVYELHYLNLIIKETLRLHPPLPLLLPRVCKDTCQVLGYKIETGTKVIINAWALGRDPKHWDDPERFKPERFEDSSIDFKGNNMEYMPFGAGKRICPGISFGLASVELALAHLLFYFDWKLPNGMDITDLDMTESFGATASRKSPLHLVAIPCYPLPHAS